MIRSKILKLESSISAKEAKNLLLKAEYVEELGRGVILSDVTRSKVSGRFFEKYVYTEEIYHPIDGMLEIERYNFSDIFFIIDFELGILTLLSNLAKKNSFSTFLGMCLDFKASIVDVKINPLNIVDKISTYFFQVKLRKLMYSNIQIDKSTKASIVISSLDDARNNDNFLSLIKKQTPSRLSFDGIYNNKRISCSISSSCSITLSNNYSEEVLLIIANEVASSW